MYKMLSFVPFLLQVIIKAYDSKQHKNVYLTLKSMNCCEIKRKKTFELRRHGIVFHHMLSGKGFTFQRPFQDLHRSPNKAQFDLYFPVPYKHHYRTPLQIPSYHVPLHHLEPLCPPGWISPS